MRSLQRGARGVWVILCQHQPPINRGCPAALPTLPLAASSSSFPFLPPTPTSQFRLSIFQVFLLILTFHPSNLNNTQHQTHHASQESNRCDQESRRPASRFLPRYVYSDPARALHRVEIKLISLVSRMSADSIHIDMIKDAIVNVSRSPSPPSLL